MIQKAAEKAKELGGKFGEQMVVHTKKVLLKLIIKLN